MSTKETRHDIVDDYLNAAHEEVVICGCTFSPADILFELDPIAYRCLAADLGADEEEEEEESEEECGE